MSLQDIFNLESVSQDVGLVSRAASDSKLHSHLSSATSLAKFDLAELPQLTEPEMIQRVVKKIRALYGSCSTEESGDVFHMLGSIQVTTCIAAPHHFTLLCATLRYLEVGHACAMKHRRRHLLIVPTESTSDYVFLRR